VAAVAMPDGACVPYLADSLACLLTLRCCKAGWATGCWTCGLALPRRMLLAVPLDARGLLLGDEIIRVCGHLPGEAVDAAQGLWLHLWLLFHPVVVFGPRLAVAGLRQGGGGGAA
jgi:hypothetical protein